MEQSPDTLTAIFGLIGGLIGLAIFLAIAIFFILNQQKVLKSCAPENRALEPGLVWLYLIPIFNLFWCFWIVIKTRDSLAAEFRSREKDSSGENFGYSVGLAWCICSIASIIPLLGLLVAIAGLVCFILYWIKMADYAKRLA